MIGACLAVARCARALVSHCEEPAEGHVCNMPNSDCNLTGVAPGDCFTHQHAANTCRMLLGRECTVCTLENAQQEAFVHSPGWARDGDVAMRAALCVQSTSTFTAAPARAATSLAALPRAALVHTAGTPSDADPDCAGACAAVHVRGVCVYHTGACKLVEGLTLVDVEVVRGGELVVMGECTVNPHPAGVGAVAPTTACASGDPRRPRMQIGAFKGALACAPYVPENATQAFANFPPNENRTDRAVRVFAALDGDAAHGFDSSKAWLQANGFNTALNTGCEASDFKCLPGMCRVLAMSYFNDPTYTSTTEASSFKGHRNFNVNGPYIDVTGYSQCDAPFGTRIDTYTTPDSYTTALSASSMVTRAMVADVRNADGIGPMLWPTRLPVPSIFSQETTNPNPPYMYGPNRWVRNFTQGGPMYPPVEYTCSGLDSGEVRTPPAIMWLVPVPDDIAPGFDYRLKFGKFPRADFQSALRTTDDGALVYAYARAKGTHYAPPLLDPTLVACRGGAARAVVGHVTYIDNCARLPSGERTGHFGVMPSSYAMGLAFVVGFPQPASPADPAKSMPGLHGKHMQVLGIVFPPTVLANFGDDALMNAAALAKAIALVNKLNARIDTQDMTAGNWEKNYNNPTTCNVFSSAASMGRGCAWLPKSVPTSFCPDRAAASLVDALIVPQSSAETKYGGRFGLFDFAGNYECTSFHYTHVTNVIGAQTCRVARANFDAKRAQAPKSVTIPMNEFIQDASQWYMDSPADGDPGPYDESGVKPGYKTSDFASLDNGAENANNMIFRRFADTSVLAGYNESAFAPASLPFALTYAVGYSADGTVPASAKVVGYGDDSDVPPSIGVDTDTIPMIDTVVDHMKCASPFDAFCDASSDAVATTAHAAYQACPVSQCSPGATKSDAITNTHSDMHGGPVKVSYDLSGGKTRTGKCACCSHGDVWDTEVGIALGAGYVVGARGLVGNSSNNEETTRGCYPPSPPSPPGVYVVANGASYQTLDAGECTESVTYRPTPLPCARSVDNVGGNPQAAIVGNRPCIETMLDFWRPTSSDITTTCPPAYKSPDKQTEAVEQAAALIGDGDYASRCAAIAVARAGTGANAIDTEPGLDIRYNGVRMIGGVIATDLFYDDDTQSAYADAMKKSQADQECGTESDAYTMGSDDINAYWWEVSTGISVPFAPVHKSTLVLNGALKSVDTTKFSQVTVGAGVASPPLWGWTGVTLYAPPGKWGITVRMVGQSRSKINVKTEVEVDGGTLGTPFDAWMVPDTTINQLNGVVHVTMVSRDDPAPKPISWGAQWGTHPNNARAFMGFDDPPPSSVNNYGYAKFKVHGFSVRDPAAVVDAIAMASLTGLAANQFAWAAGTMAAQSAFKDAVKQVVATNYLPGNVMTVTQEAMIEFTGSGPPRTRQYASSSPRGSTCTADGGAPVYFCERMAGGANTGGVFLTAYGNMSDADKNRSEVVVCGYRFKGTDNFGMALGRTPRPVYALTQNLFAGGTADRTLLDMVFKPSEKKYGEGLALTAVDGVPTVHEHVYPGTCPRYPHGAAHPDSMQTPVDGAPYIDTNKSTLRKTYYTDAVLLRYCEMVVVDRSSSLVYVENDPLLAADRKLLCKKPNADTLDGGAELPTTRTFADACTPGGHADRFCIFIPGYDGMRTLADFMAHDFDFTNYTIYVFPVGARAFTSGGFYRQRLRQNHSSTSGVTVSSITQRNMFDLVLSASLTAEANVQQHAYDFFNEFGCSSNNPGEKYCVPSYDEFAPLAMMEAEGFLNGTGAVIRHPGVTITSVLNNTPMVFGPAAKSSRTNVRIFVGAPRVTVGSNTFSAGTDQSLCAEGGGFECATIVLAGEDVSGSTIYATEGPYSAHTSVMVLGASIPAFEHAGKRVVNADGVSIHLPQPQSTGATFAAAVSAASGQVQVCAPPRSTYHILVEGANFSLITSANCAPVAVTNLSAIEALLTPQDVEDVYHRPSDTTPWVWLGVGVCAATAAVAIAMHAFLFYDAQYVTRFLVARSGIALEVGVVGKGWRTVPSKRGVCVEFERGGGVKNVSLHSIEVIAAILSGSEGGCGRYAGSPDLVEYVLDRAQI